MAIRAMGPRRPPLVALPVLVLGVALFFLFGPPSALMNLGFQSQVCALWMLVFQVWLGSMAELDERPQLRLALVLVALVGVTWAWYLVTPVATAVAMGTVWSDRRRLMQRSRSTLVLSSIIALALPPIYYGVTSGAPKAVNAHGGVYILDRVFIAILLVPTAAAWFLPWRRPGSRGRAIAGAALAVSGLLAGGLHWYQVRTVGDAGYFYEKLLHTVAVLAGLGVGALILAVVASAIAEGGIPRWRQAGLAAACAALLWLSTGVLTDANLGRDYLTGNRIFPDHGVTQHLLENSGSPDQRQVLFWSDDSPISDYLASRFAAAIYLRNTSARNDLTAVSAFAQDDRKLLILLRVTPGGIRLLTRNRNLRARLVAEGYTSADLDRLVIDVVTEPPTGPREGLAQRSYDISARALLPGLFHPRVSVGR